MGAKFQLDYYTYSCFIAEDASLQNEEKTKKKNNFFAQLYLGIGWSDLLQIWYTELPILQTSVLQIWLNSGKRSWSYIGVRMMFSLAICIVWCAGFLIHTTHYHVFCIGK